MSCPHLASLKQSRSEPLHYHNYLKVDSLLNLQELETEKAGVKEHDEHLFIVVHQAFELWFKEVLVELDSVMCLLPQQGKLSLCVTRMARVKLIMQHVMNQFAILETMTPLNFREFRDFLAPASGFQSQQFRIIENKFGVRSNIRIKYQQDSYKVAFDQVPELKKAINQSESALSMFDAVTRWLEGIHTADGAGNCFVTSFKSSVEDFIATKPAEDQAAATATYASFFEAAAHQACVTRGERHLSLAAMQAALLVNFGKDDAKYHLHYQFMTLLVDLDSLLMQWRFSHITTVLRMLGVNQTGTAGTAGYPYLSSTLSDRYYVFLDLANLSSFMLPRCVVRGTEQYVAAQLKKAGQEEGKTVAQ